MTAFNEVSSYFISYDDEVLREEQSIDRHFGPLRGKLQMFHEVKSFVASSPRF